jgi:membrane-associated phospholipid phosphatase
VELLLDSHRRALALTAVALLAGAVLCTGLSKVTGIFPSPDDLDSYASMKSLAPPLRHAVDAEVFLARPRAALPIVVVLALVCWRIRGPRWALAALATPFVVLFTTVAKAIPPDSTLPSGHSAYALATFGMAALVAWGAGQRFVAAALAAIGLAMGPARVLEGAHHTADVVVGDALGLAWLLFLLLRATSPGRS